MIQYYYDDDLECYLITRDNEILFTTNDINELYQVLDDVLKD